MAVTIREVKLGDYEGIMKCLSELTVVGNVDEESFNKRLRLRDDKKDYLTIVAEHDGEIIGTATLLKEYKFIRELGTMGHIEDVVVKKEWRGKGVGKMMVDYLSKEARKSCYKISLCCDPKNVEFYKKCGFREKEREMVIYYV